MALKMTHLKDDAIVEVKVNGTFYHMLKLLASNLLMDAIKQVGLDQKVSKKPDSEKIKGIDELVNKIMNTKYEELECDYQRGFLTITLLLAEIEKQAKDHPELTEEKEYLEPGDEGYVDPANAEK